MKYYIYNRNNIYDIRDIKLKNLSDYITEQSYQLVYEGEIENADNILEKLFVKFQNMSDYGYPKDYTGRSLVCGDVIAIEKDYIKTAYLIEAFKFDICPNFFNYEESEQNSIVKCDIYETDIDIDNKINEIYISIYEAKESNDIINVKDYKLIRTDTYNIKDPILIHYLDSAPGSVIVINNPLYSDKIIYFKGNGWFIQIPNFFKE